MAIFTKAYEKTLWGYILHYSRDIKCAWERANRGYSYRDINGMDTWFTNIMPKMLKTLKDNEDNKHPGGMTYEEWQGILEQMIYYFTEADYWKAIYSNKYDDKIPVDPTVESYRRKSHYEDQYIEKMEARGLEMFVEYFGHLWT